MTTPIQSQDQDENLSNQTQIVDSPTPALPLQAPAPLPAILSTQKEAEEEEYFYFEEDPSDLIGTPFVTPFQLSNAMSMLAEQPRQQTHQVSDNYNMPTPLPVKKEHRKPRFSLTMIAIIVCAVVISSVMLMNVLAQATPPLQKQASSQMTKPPGNEQKKPIGPQQKPVTKPDTGPTNGTNGQDPKQNQNQSQGQNQAATEWVPQQLPTVWTNAGLQMGDGIQALRTAVAFNDREMSLDYRSVGTRDNHGGTFTAATFILTPAAKQRFTQNDVRVINNTLFDSVQNTKLVRVVINPQPTLANFSQAGQQQFAWVDVRFQLWESKIDPNNLQQHVEGKDVDPNTNQPYIHHMMVLLLRVPQQNVGNNPTMGGTGWLVSNYGLGAPDHALPAIVQPA